MKNSEDTADEPAIFLRVETRMRHDDPIEMPHPDLPRQSLEDVNIVAEHVIFKLLPPQLRTMYATDRRVSYQAEEIVYFLQWVSASATALLVGLITNYLYDKLKKPPPVDLRSSIRAQEERLAKLEVIFEKTKAAESASSHSQILEFHRKLLIDIQDNDPKIAEMVEQVLHQLNKGGKKALEDEVQAHLSHNKR